MQQNLVYTYDPSKGYLSGISTLEGNSITYAYDGILLTGETWAGDVAGSVSWTYDNNLRATAIKVNNGSTINYQYDDDSLITKAGDLILTHSAQNDFLTATSLGSVTDTRTYSGFGEIASYVARYNTSEIFRQDFIYDKLGRITQKVETVADITDTYEYEYDATGNLTGVKKKGTPTASYSYDSNDNRLTGPSVTTTYTLDAQDRVITRSSDLGTESYEYTANGDLKGKTAGTQTAQYTYDAFGNLKHVTLPDGRVLEYGVDGQNRRLGKKVNSAWVQKFLFLNQRNPIAELDGSNNIVSLFIYGTRAVVPDYMVKGEATYRIISDHLGSPRLVIDVATGNVAQRMDYDEFGKVTNDTNPGFQPFGFAGGIYDPDTGLVRFGARDYDPDVGRWTAKDPSGFSSGPNLYSYAYNNPVSLIDPLGDKPEDTVVQRPGDIAGRNPTPRGMRHTPEQFPQNTCSGEIITPTPARPKGGTPVQIRHRTYLTGPQPKSNLWKPVPPVSLPKVILKCIPYLQLLEVLDVIIHPDRKVYCEDLDPAFRFGCVYRKEL